MTEIADRYRRLSERFADHIGAVPDDAWDAPTPCDDWTVRQLVAHVVSAPATFEGLVGREMPNLPSVDDDPAGVWDAARSVVLDDLDDPRRATAEFDGFFGHSTFEQAVDRFMCFDLVVHGWDLAHALGVDDTIEPEDLARVRTGAEAFGDMLHSPGVCGPEVAVPAEADEQTRVLGTLGRQA